MSDSKSIGDVLAKVITGEEPSWASAFARAFASWVGLAIAISGGGNDLLGEQLGLALFLATALFVAFFVALSIKALKHMARLHSRRIQIGFANSEWVKFDQDTKEAFECLYEFFFQALGRYPSSETISFNEEKLSNYLETGIEEKAKYLSQRKLISFVITNSNVYIIRFYGGMHHLLQKEFSKKRSIRHYGEQVFFRDYFPLILYGSFLALIFSADLVEVIQPAYNWMIEAVRTHFAN